LRFGANIDCAVAFKIASGDKGEVSLVSHGTEQPPAGDLVIRPYWGGYEKDRLVGGMIDADLHPFIRGMTVIGIALLTLSAILAIDPGRRARQD